MRRRRYGLPVPRGIRHVFALRLAAATRQAAEARRQAAADRKLRKIEEQRARQMRIDMLADRLREAGWTLTGRATYAFKNAGFPLERSGKIISAGNSEAVHQPGGFARPLSGFRRCPFIQTSVFRKILSVHYMPHRLGRLHGCSFLCRASARSPSVCPCHARTGERRRASAPCRAAYPQELGHLWKTE